MSLNSTMVRLKPPNTVYSKIYFLRSQFHYGSIKTWFQNRANFQGMERSQFHYGSIKTMQIRFMRNRTF